MGGSHRALPVLSYLLPWPEQLLNPLTQANSLTPLACTVPARHRTGMPWKKSEGAQEGVVTTQSDLTGEGWATLIQRAGQARGTSWTPRPGTHWTHWTQPFPGQEPGNFLDIKLYWQPNANRFYSPSRPRASLLRVLSCSLSSPPLPHSHLHAPTCSEPQAGFCTEHTPLRP